MKHIVRQFGTQAKKSKSSGGKGSNRNAYFAEQAEKQAKRLPAISKIIICLFLIIGVVSSFFVCKFMCKDDLFEINGKKSYSLTVNQEYIDEGVTVVGFGMDLSSKVNIEVYDQNKNKLSGLNAIDTTQEGTYQIVYTVSSLRYKDIQLIRTVTIVSDEVVDPDPDAYPSSFRFI